MASYFSSFNCAVLFAIFECVFCTGNLGDVTTESALWMVSDMRIPRTYESIISESKRDIHGQGVEFIQITNFAQLNLDPYAFLIHSLYMYIRKNYIVCHRNGWCDTRHVLCSRYSHFTLDFQKGKKMRNVTLKKYGAGKDLKGGFVQSELVNGSWYWDFYESRQLKWSLTCSGSLKKNAEFTHSFSIDKIIHSRREDKKVHFSFKPFLTGEVEEYTLIFANDNDAKTFNGEIRRF